MIGRVVYPVEAGVDVVQLFCEERRLFFEQSVGTAM